MKTETNLRHLLTGAMFLCGLSSTLAQEAIPLGETWFYPPDAKGAAAGFTGRIVQARKNAGLTATVARGNAHLQSALIDPAMDQAYENLVIDTDNPAATNGEWPGTATDPGGSFRIDGVINFSSDNAGFPVSDGNFSDVDGVNDLPFPGLPGADDGTFELLDNGQNFSIEVLTYLELPAGEIILGVHHDDAVELAIHPNNARDIFRQRVTGFDSNSGKAERTALVHVPTAGLYSVRILMAQWNGDAALEFYTADPADESALTLVNDPNVDASIKAWQSLNINSRPYVTTVSPNSNATGVAKDTAIQVTMKNAGDENPVMKVDGTTVTVEKSVNGDNTHFTYTPATPFESGQTVTVELSYGEATSTWSFVTFSGRKALLITGGGQLNGADGWVAARLASNFGFDVEVKGDDSVSVDDAVGAALVFNSSTVNSGKVAPHNFEELAIPLVNVEAGNVDDFFLADSPLPWGNGPNGGTDTVMITDESHPMNAALAPGEQILFSNNIQYHWGVPPEDSIVIGRPPGNEEQGTIYAIEAGAEMLDESGDVLFTHPARRVFFGVTGNDGAASYTETGVKLFDAAITWALETASADGKPTIRDITVGENVQITFTTTAQDSPHALQRATHLQNWTVDDSATLTQDGDIFQFSTDNREGAEEYFRVALLEPPALFMEDFESGAQGWEAKLDSGDVGWELGSPGIDALTSAHSGLKVYGTDLDGNYGDMVNASLTSPIIDLTDVRRARLTFWYFVDTEEGAEGLQLSYLDEAGILPPQVHGTILSGQSDGWVEFDERIPSELIGSEIRLRFLFLSDDSAPYGAGFYIDDVEVDD